jgi:hypothetical protein
MNGRFGKITKSVIKSFYLLGYNSVYSLKVNRRFGGTYRLHFQGRRIIIQARNRREAGTRIEHFMHTAVRILNPTSHLLIHYFPPPPQIHDTVYPCFR